MRKRKQKSGKMVALVLALIFAFSVPAQEAHAEEAYLNEDTTMKVTVTNMSPEYSISDVRPITTMFDCEIIMAFKMDEGLCMTFTTSCIGAAKVIGVKDIKVQQKMWYGWEKGLTYVSEGTITSQEYMDKLEHFVRVRTKQVEDSNFQPYLRQFFDAAAVNYKIQVGKTNTKTTARAGRSRTYQKS